MRLRLGRRCAALAIAAALSLAGCDLAARPVRQADQVGVDPTGETIATDSPKPPSDPAPAQPDDEQEFVAPERIPQQPPYGGAEPPPQPRQPEPEHRHGSHRHRRSSD
jgi:hypothetical protein